MSKFLLIENPGVAALESFTLLGASNKSGSGAIGQFGSGTKFGALTLLRKGVYPVVTVGTLRLEYGLEDIVFQGAEHQQVVVTLKGKTEEGKQVNRTEKLSVVLNYGVSDWTHLSLAVREYVSNALDASNGDTSVVRVELVDNVRAAAGKTRVYIPLSESNSAENKEILEVFANLPTWFLHFDANSVWRTSSIITKATVSKPRIYRRGVYVRTVSHAESSLFDYNLNDLSLDEARVANDYSVKYAAGKFFRQKATSPQLAKLLVCETRTWEAEFDLTGVYDSLSEADEKSCTSRWRGAQELAIGGNQVILHPQASPELAKGKGYSTVVVPAAVYEACVLHGLRTTTAILTVDEREGRKIDTVADPLVTAAVQHVWDKIAAIGFNNNESFPEVGSFSEPGTSAGVSVNGFYRDGGVYINTKLLGGDVLSPELFATVLEELCHYITKATDCSRDFQNWLISVIAKILK